MNLPNDSHDEMDRILSSFFKAQMPAQWPDAPSVSASRSSATIVPATERSTAPMFTSSRVSLAASVAILIGSCWYLSQSVPTQNGLPQPSSLIRGSEATLPPDRNPMKDHIPVLPMDLKMLP